MVKFSKHWTPLQNSPTPTITPSEGLAMPCVKCIVMESAIHLVLIPNRSDVYKIMYELVIIESNKQHTNSLFIIHINFNKLEALLSWAFTLATKPL
jgi:hypothetical protein